LKAIQIVEYTVTSAEIVETDAILNKTENSP